MKRYGVVFALVLAVAALVAMIGGLAACGNAAGTSSSSNSTASPSSATGPASFLPAAIKSSGVLSVGAEIDFPPMESYANGNTVVGLDAELMQGIAKVLGLKLKWINMNWDGLRPALESGRFDAICSSMGDFADRQKQVTFVDYLNINEAVLVKKANLAGITKVQDLGGKTISGELGTVAQTGAVKLNNTLTAEGVTPMKLLVFNTDSEGMLAVRAGRVFGHIMDTPVAIYEAKTAGNGQVYGAALPGVIPGFPYGIAVDKNSTLAEAVQGALNQMISDGAYGKLMAKYSTQANAVKSATINGGKSSSGA